MITQQQAERAVELLKEIENNIDYLADIHNDWWNSRDRLFAEIKANEPTTTAEQTQNWTAIKAKTNGDLWRAMTDEQIAEIIAADGCTTCPADGVDWNCSHSDKQCKAAIVKWLKQEAAK